MTFENLKKLEQRVLLNEHYQHKSMSQEERNRQAALSFKRLPENQRAKAVKSWQDYCTKYKLTFNISELIWYRFLAQTNLFFLCHLLEKYSQTTEFTHEEICNDFFVSKDPTFSTFEQFANSYPKEKKERMLLVPRNGFKSSIDMADTVQWVVCFPEITILILCGVLPLAKDFVKEIKNHFTYESIGTDEKGKPKYGVRKLKGADGEWSESLFQILFPEHCVEPNDGPENKFQTPAVPMGDKETTIMSAGIDQNLSGWHFGIMKFDDVVTNENSQTQTRLAAVNNQISINKAMLNPFGFFDVIGTWYDENDYYGISIAHEEQLAKDGEPSSLIVYLRSAWWPTPAAKKAGLIEDEMKEEDWVLWFPERLNYAFLRKEKKKDPEGFVIKYENDPRKVHAVKFPRDLLVRRTIPSMQLPHQGLIVTCVDTAYSTKNFADYTVLITALIYGGAFYIIDMVRNKFNEYDLPKVIAATGNKWKPKRMAIEDSTGVRWLTREIRREMDALGISIPIEFVSLGGANHAKSKEIKAKPVQRLLGDSRLFFSNSCQGLDELYSELEGFPNKTHDDIVSALSILVDQFAAYADMDQRVSATNVAFNSDQKSKEVHDMLYGLGRYAQHNANFALSDHPKTAFQLGQVAAVEADKDPLQDLFG